VREGVREGWMDGWRKDERDTRTTDSSDMKERFRRISSSTSCGAGPTAFLVASNAATLPKTPPPNTHTHTHTHKFSTVSALVHTLYKVTV
jgi:hypothetical protein